MAYIYMLRCKGNSLYTGITTDIARRLREHAEGKGVGAKYTRAHPPIEVAALWEADDLQMAARIEYRLKRLTAQKKRLLDLPRQTHSRLSPNTEVFYPEYLFSSSGTFAENYTAILVFSLHTGTRYATIVENLRAKVMKCFKNIF